jgi:hypothetical protein
MATDWTPQEEEGLVGYLADRIVARAAGRLDSECLQNHPRDVYFIGNLRSRRETPDAHGSLPFEVLNKLSPVAIAAEAQLGARSPTSLATITVSWAAYYRVFPTFEQQNAHQEARTDVRPEAPPSNNLEDQRQDVQADLPDDHQGDTSATRTRRLAHRDHLALRYRKICGSATANVPMSILPSAPGAIDLRSLQTAINNEIQRCREAAARDPEIIRVSASRERSIPILADALESRDRFAMWQASFSNPVVPDWGLTVQGTAYKLDSDDDIHLISIELVNDSAPVDDPLVEPFIFDPALSLEFFGCDILPFKIELVPKGFRFDPYIWGRGYNCEVRLSGTNHLSTHHTPTYRQARYVTKTDPPARFSDLAAAPIVVLERIRDAMEAYLSVWDAAEQQYGLRQSWTQGFQAEFARDREYFVKEIERFREGLRLVDADPDVRLAFQLTNETFLNLGRHQQPEKTKESWRLFQIVFLVAQIPGMYALRHPSATGMQEREMVDVIYFPTGGGKTEAYLGTIIFHCFFDRLRGKTAGVTCWTRFPLRLLTIQQTQRIADAIGMAEIIRVNHADPRISQSGDRFAVGYLVGAEATPNELEPPSDGQLPNVSWSQAADPVARQQWKRVATCPSCRSDSIVVDLDTQKIRLIHRCTNSSCRLPGGEVPVYITDNEIFRYLPSVVVGTVDKLAGLGNQRKFALLLGQVDGRCREHGYYKGMCCQKGCKDKTRLARILPPGISGPTLIVQDELHLLKEGLGTFDSHYESFFQSALAQLGAVAPIKIIGSSATIEQFERQIEHLYGKMRSRARIFPGVGPTLSSSFYAETLSHSQRIFVGLLPHNKTLFNAVLEMIESYHRELIHLRTLTGANPWNGALVPQSGAWRDIVDYYWVSLIYFLASRDLNAIRTDLEGDVNPRLQADGLPALSVNELTGEVSTNEVTATLAMLERMAGAGGPPRTVLATNMVSHGVDIDRLNAMLFYGMPRLTAEYIQASSRVGRSHVGLVFTCLHPVRERDQSHYHYFSKYHEFLGQLVEPVAINRWATYSIDRTIPGLFMAILLQFVAHRPGVTNPNSVYFLDYLKREISSGALRAEDFLPLLESSYLVNGDTGGPGRQSFQPRIAQRVRQFLDHILQASGTDTFVSSALIPSPMRSLRDVEEPITIELDSEGSDWAAGQ